MRDLRRGTNLMQPVVPETAQLRKENGLDKHQRHLTINNSKKPTAAQNRRGTNVQNLNFKRNQANDSNICVDGKSPNASPLRPGIGNSLNSHSLAQNATLNASLVYTSNIISLEATVNEKENDKSHDSSATNNHKMVKISP